MRLACKHGLEIAVDHCDSEGNCVQQLPPRLLALIAARLKSDSAGVSDCEGVIDGDSLAFLMLHPTRHGLVFSTNLAHLVQACDDDVEIPWKTLEPFLTGQGKAIMQTLITPDRAHSQ